MIFPFGETVTRRRPTDGTPNRLGQPTQTWTDTAIFGVGVAPGSSEDGAQVFRADVTIDFTLYFPAGSDVDARDRLVVRGVEHTIEGAPAEWLHPMTGWQPGIVVKVSRVEG